MKFITEKYLCEKLEWDTKYFGIKSAKVTLKEGISESELKYISEMLCDYEFVTITNLNNNSTNNYLLGRHTNAFLVDVNIQFEKKVILPQSNADTNIIIENSMQANTRIKQIAANSFVYSRFFNDPFLDKEKAHKIYENWVNNSFENENKYFVHLSLCDKIVGFILFSYLPETLGVVIELITVDDEYSGQGIGKKMIVSLENYIFKAGYKTIKVGTQVDNLLAQNFYSSCGFRHKQCNSVYHLWNQ